MIKNFIIPLYIYPFDIMVSVNQTDKQLTKSLAKYGVTKEACEELMNLPSTVNGRTVQLPSKQCVLRLRQVTDEKDEFHAVIAHEVFHIVSLTLHEIGIRLDVDSSDEAYAYLIGYVTDIIYKKLKL